MTGFNSVEDAWWIEADVRRADTHVYWTARSAVGKGATKRRVATSCDFDAHTAIEVFLDLIRRSVILTVNKVEPEGGFFHEHGWERIEDQLQNRSREVESGVWAAIPWYQLTVKGVGDGRVAFDCSAYGYKYLLRDLVLPEGAFYELSDRLEARMRFGGDWAGIDQAVESLHVIARDEVTSAYSERLIDVAHRLRATTPSTYESAARDLLAYLEGILRKQAEDRGWKGKTDNLPNLIERFRGNVKISSEDLGILRFSIPIRDYLQHGHRPSMHMGKTAVVTSVEALERVVRVLRETDRAD